MITSMLRSAHTAKKWYRSMLAGNEAYSPGAYELISTTLISSDTSTVTFSSIVGTYKHLQIRVAARTTGTGTGDGGLQIQLNSDTAANYAQHSLEGNGSAVSSGGSASTSNIQIGASAGGGTSANIFGVSVIDILDYANTNKNTTIRGLSGANGTSSRVALKSGVWLNTAAVSSILLYRSGLSFVAGSRFSLYGIKG